MTKRPLLSTPKELRTRVCLDFGAWKAQYTGAEADNNDEGHVYDPSSEDPPDCLWYTLDLELLRTTIQSMCEELARPVADCKTEDPEVIDLLKALRRAQKFPRPRKLKIAVVGNQGVGKSSAINALLNRYLVDASASSSACTAFATIVEYKEGAADDTNMSDLKVTFLELDEIRDFIEEHIRRYADVYVPSSTDKKVESSGEENELSRDEASESDHSEDDVSDSGSSGTSDHPVRKHKKRKKVSKALQLGADTAEQFFRIIFNADCDEEKELDLHKWLNSSDIEDGQFLDHCSGLAMSHLEQIEAEEAGSVEYTDVCDVDLQRVRDHAARMWPLVKAVTISTGSVLLRNGIQLMDLPGYGDLNQTRTAVVNEYRRLANFEIVVAKSDRYLSKTDEDRFLNRAVRHHEAKNVFLVLNKADVSGFLVFLLHNAHIQQSCLETPQHQVIHMLESEVEEPFATIYQHLSDLRGLTGENRSIIQKYRRYLIREAQMADGQRECNKIKRKMQRKGVQVFPISAARYFEWLEPSPLEDPPYGPEGTGIPLLRQALLMLPAKTNYEDMYYHIFEILADVEDKVSRILMKFTNDVDMAAIRRYLLAHLPKLGSDLNGLSDTVPGVIVPVAWDDSAKRKISSGMEDHLMALPDESSVYYSTFWLMLRNNGISTHGRYPGKNLNEELLQKYKGTIKTWKIKTAPGAKDLTSQLNGLVQDTIKELVRRLQAAASDPELKLRVSEALQKLSRRIGLARDTLVNQLESSVDENYRHFTTEDDVKCPIAQEMKTAYQRINCIRMVERPKHRRGIYRQQRTELIRTLTKNNGSKASLVDAISVQIKTRQCKHWQVINQEFITSALAHFSELAQAMAELLENEAYMSDAHKQVRRELGEQLSGFRKSLAKVKGQFPDLEMQRATKKARAVEIKVEMEELSGA
ncbi:hypothetical protein N0V95_008266 [Ascochyta clinopodiicola]|nr:hypothetical protein N0V95_008266 [Ascochyta clinopodiicola]